MSNEHLRKTICRAAGWTYSQGYAFEKTGDRLNCTTRLDALCELVKARDDRIVAELQKQKDTHSHMTRNYCTDCAKRDNHNAVIDQAIKVIRNTN